MSADGYKREIATEILSLFGQDTSKLGSLPTEDLIGRAAATVALKSGQDDYAQDVSFAISGNPQHPETIRNIETFLGKIESIGLNANKALTVESIQQDMAQDGRYNYMNITHAKHGQVIASVQSDDRGTTNYYRPQDMDIEKLQDLRETAYETYETLASQTEISHEKRIHLIDEQNYDNVDNSGNALIGRILKTVTVDPEPPAQGSPAPGAQITPQPI